MGPFTVWLITTAISLAVNYFLAPKPPKPKPAGLGEFQVPTAEDGREIPVLFGTRDIAGPNVIFYGNLKVTAIKDGGGKK